MNARDALRMAWARLGGRKGRTALTLAGVVIGVAALVLMVSLGLGLERHVVGLFRSETGLRSLSLVRPQAGAKSDGGFEALLDFRNRFVPISDRDLEEISRVPGVQVAFPNLGLYLRFTLEGEGALFAAVAAVPPEEEARFADLLRAGQIWAAGERACLLPSALVEDRLGGRPAAELVGRKVVFDGDAEPWRIAGILDSGRLGLLGGQVQVPLRQGLDLRRATRGGLLPQLYHEDGYTQVEVRASDPRRVDEVAARLRNLGYQVTSISDLVGKIKILFLVAEAVLAAVGGIGLVVSLFGIANTMAMAVLERTREIGIMKALGARDRDVRRLFLSEAGTIGALGGGLGLGLAWLAGAAANALARGAWKLDPDFRLFHVSAWLAAGSVVFAGGVSVLAGWLPARRAARMDPVDALRYE